jgi:hypothetical protein
LLQPGTLNKQGRPLPANFGEIGSQAQTMKETHFKGSRRIARNSWCFGSQIPSKSRSDVLNQILGIPRIWQNSGNFVTRNIPELGLPCENGEFFHFHESEPGMLGKRGANAQLGAPSIIGKNRPSCCGAYRAGFI